MIPQEASGTTAKVLVIGYLVLLVNSSYLAAYANPSLFYFGSVAFHLLMGIALAIAFAVYALKRLNRFSIAFRLACASWSERGVWFVYNAVRRDPSVSLGPIFSYRSR